MEAIDSVLGVWAMLVFWDEAKYLGSDNRKAVDPTSKGANKMEVDVAAVTEAVQDPTFRVYAEMLRLVEDVLIALQRWGDSCSCHSHSHDTHTHKILVPFATGAFPSSSCQDQRPSAPWLGEGLLSLQGSSLISSWDDLHNVAMGELLVTIPAVAQRWQPKMA